MLQPVRRRTWAPRGETPIQKAWDRHDRLPNLAAISVSPVRHHLGLYFQLLPENVRNEQMLWFLTKMHRHFGRNIILIWDRSSVHRSVAATLTRLHPDWFQFEWLPAYAPQLNPVEQCWNHTKYADLSNFIPDDVNHLHDAVSGSIQDQQQDQPLLGSFFQTAKLELNSSQ